MVSVVRQVSLQKLKGFCVIRKKTNYHVASCISPRVSGQTMQKCDLFTMSKYPALDHRSDQQNQTLLFDTHSGRSNNRAQHPKRMVEPDGIEPTTSCLQSRRSPS
jgi:hypothetical protein